MGLITKRDSSTFNRKSYDKNDEWAISKVKDYLKGKGYTIKDKEKEDYWIDITAERNDKTVNFEVEVKVGYPFTNKDDFKFSSVSFLARKKKWEDVGFWYIIVCRETLAIVSCHSDNIFKDEYMESMNVDSKYRKGKDLFYRVPKDKCYWSNLKKET